MINDDIYDSMISILMVIALAVIYVFWPSVEWNGIDIGLALKSSSATLLVAAAVLAVLFKDKALGTVRQRL